MFAGVVGALFAVVGGGHGYQSNRLKLYRPVGIIFVYGPVRTPKTSLKDLAQKTGRADAAASAASADTL